MQFLRRSLVGLLLLSLTVGLLAVAGGTVYSAMQERWNREAQQRPRNERVFSVDVLVATVGDEVPQVTAFGEIRSQRVLDLRATAGGSIVELSKAFDEGGTVKSGMLLVRIDAQNAQSSLDRARADLTEAKAEVSEAERALELAGDEVLSAEKQSELRAQSLLRQQNLRKRGVGTDAAVETAALAEAAALQVVLSRRQALQVAGARVTKSVTNLGREQVNVAEAERRLADTEIYATFDGTLSDVSAVQGAVVSNNEHLAQLIDTNALEVSFRVSTNQYSHLLDQDGKLTKAPVDVLLDVSGVDMVAQGQVSREGAVVGDGLTGRLLFASLNKSSGFRAGDFVTVAAKEPILRDVTRLPASAVDAAGTVLVVGQDDRLEQINVEVLRKQGNDVLVRADAIVGREVIAQRSPLFGAGIKVRPIRQGAPVMAEPEMLDLTDARRAKLIAFVEANQRMPAEAKARALAQLAKGKAPAQMVERIESRMGG